jgi:excisionase family DNA binding protein
VSQELVFARYGGCGSHEKHQPAVDAHLTEVLGVSRRRLGRCSKQTMSDLDPLIRTGVLRLIESDYEFRHDLAVMLRNELAAMTDELDSTAAAVKLGFNRETVVKMAKRGRIPGAHKQGREWRFPARDLTVLPRHRSNLTAVEPRPTRRPRTHQSPSSAVEALMQVAHAS